MTLTNEMSRKEMPNMVFVADARISASLDFINSYARRAIQR